MKRIAVAAIIVFSGIASAEQCPSKEALNSAFVHSQWEGSGTHESYIDETSEEIFGSMNIELLDENVVRIELNYLENQQFLYLLPTTLCEGRYRIYEVGRTDQFGGSNHAKFDGLDLLTVFNSENGWVVSHFAFDDPTAPFYRQSLIFDLEYTSVTEIHWGPPTE